MKLTPKIQKAIIRATLLHDCQLRKGDDLPFIVHPFSVAFILACYTEDENVIAAGLLHDACEEVRGCGYGTIKKDFGKKVADIVQEVTENSEPTNRKKNRESWKKRKKNYIKNLETCSSEALMVSAADKIHNLLSMMSAYEARGEKLWDRFNADKKDSRWFYLEVIKIIKNRLESPIVSELEQAYKRSSNIFK